MTALERIDARPRAARLTVADFLLLDRSGAFDAYARTELIDGAVVVVNADFSEHYIVKSRFYRRIADACDALGHGIEAWMEGSIEIPPHDIPQPDIFVTDTLPAPGLTRVDIVLLAVEIAHSSLREDLGGKLSLYARAGIPEYWVVDVKGGVIRRMWSPVGERYARRDKTAIGDAIAAATIGGLVVETAGILPE